MPFQAADCVLFRALVKHHLFSVKVIDQLVGVGHHSEKRRLGEISEMRRRRIKHILAEYKFTVVNAKLVKQRGRYVDLRRWDIDSHRSRDSTANQHERYAVARQRVVKMMRIGSLMVGDKQHNRVFHIGNFRNSSTNLPRQSSV